MRTLRFDYKINNVGDMCFNYNIDVNITLILKLRCRRGKSVKQGCIFGNIFGQHFSYNQAYLSSSKTR